MYLGVTYSPADVLTLQAAWHFEGNDYLMAADKFIVDGSKKALSMLPSGRAKPLLLLNVNHPPAGVAQRDAGAGALDVKVPAELCRLPNVSYERPPSSAFNHRQ